MKKISILIPCYNEEEVLHKSAAVLLDKLDRLIQAGTISDKSKILFINDGSKDSTWQIIYELTRQNSKYAGLAFPAIMVIRARFWRV